ncbi:vWA domain-containing protein [Gordonia sp. HS-NH1]|uniref:vWA domain-containing protein n=1 Tax=Gordonia sp. HS-NH1 TaxID=1435068 RepID=UPI000B0F69F2|nr:VWA domain-containing protein [Gordonia sp. HS-NH1]
MLLESSGGGGAPSEVGRRRRTRDAPSGSTRGIGTVTDDAGARDDESAATQPDPIARERAVQLARRLRLARPVDTPKARRGANGTLTTQRWRGGSDELDLDATLEALIGNPIPEDDDIRVRERVRRRRSIVLAVDVSGSTRGEQVRTAAATAGALAGELGRDDLAVIAFWSDAALIVPLGRPVTTERLVDELLALPAQGLTNVAFPLQTALEQLAGVPSADARVILLSDCVHNAGPDPRDVAGRLPRLDVLLDTSGEHDTELAQDLALIGHGRCRPIRDHHGVVRALQAIFA